MSMPQTSPVVPNAQQPAAVRIARAAWIGLLVLGLAWELFVAPLPGGRWLLALKVVPLILLIASIWKGSAYGMQVALLVVLLYVLEAGVRLFEPAPVRWLALTELGLAVIFFAAAVAYLRPLKRAAVERRRSTE